MSGVSAVRGWREAAALILVSGAGAGQVLMQRRPAGGSFRNSVVFPGGVAERADSHPHWLHLLSSFGYSPLELAALHTAPPAAGTTTPLPLLLRTDPLARRLSLRITAIRETFEELGVLVCSREHKEQCTSHTATVITDFDIPYWQQRVSSEASALLSLCRELRCHPAVCALHWRSAWLSPAALHKRFHTAFFLAHLAHTVPTHPTSEVVDAQWASPRSLLSRPSLTLYPPQAHELVLLAHRPHTHRPPAPTNYHATVRASDGLLHVLPGDDLYPESIDYNSYTEINSECTVLELREKAHIAHRIESTAQGHALVFKNYDDMDLLVAPIHVTFS